MNMQVLLDSRGHVRLCDFGLAQAFRDYDWPPTATRFVGTPEYLAPEMVDRRAYGYDIFMCVHMLVVYGLDVNVFRICHRG